MIYEKLTEEECYLYALITDESGIDLAEFCFIDESQEDGCFRAWPFQVPWFRNQAQKHIDAASRSCGKSLSIKLRAFAFPFNYPGEEMVITAPEAVHLQAVTDNVEGLFTRNKLAREMLQGQIKHRPYHMNFVNGSRIMGRIPQRDGTGVQGCVSVNALIYTDRGEIKASEVTLNDKVWSHLNQWTAVSNVSQFVDEGFEVVGIGSSPQIVNGVHQFYGKYKINNEFTESQWANVSHLDNFYWAMPKFISSNNIISEIEDENFIYYPINKVSSIGKKTFVDLITEDHSYIADGIVSHNTHPLILEQDEASSYPEAGWTEIKETVKIQNPRARWRCIAEDQNVLTKKGWKVIQDVQIGDEVWTHKNRWRKVLNVFDNGYADCVKIVGQGIDGLIATENHKLYTRTRKRKGGLFEDSKWITSEQIIKNKNYQTSWASPVFAPDPDLAPSMEKLSSSSVIDNTNDHVWLWLYGLFIAEGYTTDFKHGHSRHRRAYWCLHDDEAPYVASLLESLGLKTSYDSGKGKSTKVCVQNASVAQWLKDEAGSLANNKGIARWVYGLDNHARQQVLNGLNYGDGSFSETRTRWEYFTVSHKLALDVKLLAQSLDYVANIRYVPPHLGEIEGRVINCAEGWTVQMRKLSEYKLPQTFKLNDNLFWSPIEAIEQLETYHVYDLEVEEDHSYVVEGIIVSNCHGVSFGIGGTFNQNISGKNSTWTVTRLPAMYRPNWTEKERRDKIEEYGGYDSSGYRRNILGLPADAGSPMFVAHRLMAVTDSNLDSEYNTIDYYNRTIDEAQIRDLISGNIEDLIKIPVLHGRYKKTWIGMDLGWTESPSSIVVFAEDKHPKKQETVLKLITRLLLRKVSPEDQVKAIIYLMNLYRPMAYALDATGAGFPLIDNLRAQVRQNDELSYMLGRIKDCQFSTKVIVGFDPDIEIDEYDPEGYLKAAIMRPFIEASTDAIRLLVDSGNIILPYDRELIDELQATPGTTKQIGNTLDAYGRSSRKQGMHNLDAMRMALFTWQTHFIDEMIESHKQIWTPPAMITY